MSQTLLSLAGFQVILIGRFWVIAEELKVRSPHVFPPTMALFKTCPTSKSTSFLCRGIVAGLCFLQKQEE
jgi:hypothetical protein